ncbi:hypothetical protein [Leptospira sp. 'Mane']|uniref:hypothetical protein n=1 Tax=Leptospira sp. 'Mane' TaxID=3387407 RepID=UPI00398ADCED
MILGHYATALLPYSRFRQFPFWVLLICANVPEFLWLVLALTGVEVTSPSSLFDASFQNLQVQMTYSHNLIPAVLQGLVVSGVVFLFFRNKSFAAWCGFLTVLHVLCDLLVGFEHQILGPDSPMISLNSYLHFPHLAILFEFLFSLACIFYYFHTEKQSGNPVPRQKAVLLISVFSIGVLMWLPSATIPMKDLLPFAIP